MIDEIAQLRATIETQTKRRTRKRKYIQTQGILTIEAGLQLAIEKGADEQETGGESLRGGGAAGAAPQQKRCGRCGEAGHNSRTCK